MMKSVNIRVVKYLSALFLAIIFVSTDGYSQRYKDRTPRRETDDKTPDTDSSKSKTKQFLEKLVPGGNFNLSIGNPTYIDVSPYLGYRVKPDLIAGLGATYIYASYRIFDAYTQQYTNKRESISLYGGRGFAEYNFYKSLYAHAEYEGLNVPYFDRFTYTEKRAWIGNPLVGGGYRSRIGQRSFINLLVLYNLNYINNSDISPYPSPFVIRMGFSL